MSGEADEAAVAGLEDSLDGLDLLSEDAACRRLALPAMLKVSG